MFGKKDNVNLEEHPVLTVFLPLFICLLAALLQLIPIVDVLFPHGSNAKADLLLDLKPWVTVGLFGAYISHVYPFFGYALSGSIRYRTSVGRALALIYIVATGGVLVYAASFSWLCILGRGFLRHILNSGGEVIPEPGETNDKGFDGEAIGDRTIKTTSHQNILDKVFFRSKNEDKMSSTPSWLPCRQQISHFQLTAVLSGVVLMMLATAFPRGISIREGIYLASLAEVLTVGLSFVMFVGFSCLGKGAFLLPARLRGSAIRLMVCAVGSYCFYGYLSERTSALSVHADFFAFNMNIAALTGGFLTLFFSYSLKGTTSRSLCFRNFLSPWLREFRWQKVVIFALCLKGIKVALKALKHDLPSEILRDYFFAILVVAVIIFAAIVSVAISTNIVRGLRGGWRHRLINLVFFISFVPMAVGKDDSWVSEIENNRSFSRFLVGKAHAILGWANFRPNRASMKYSRVLLREVELNTPIDPAIKLHVVSQGAFYRKGARVNPHVFVFLSDATTALRMGVYGYYKKNTPYLHEFSKDAVRFESYYAISSATHQNVRTMFSGYYSGRLDSFGTKKATKLCRFFKEAGYKVYTAKILEQIKNESIDDACASEEILSLFGNEPRDFREVLGSVEENPGIPHFSYIHIAGAHTPWQNSGGMELHGADLYDEMIRKADAEFGEFVDALKKAGIYDNALIVFTSDHGIGLGDHQNLASYSGVYETNIHIPLLVKPPIRWGVNVGFSVNEMFSHINFLPSLVDLVWNAPENEANFGKGSDSNSLNDENDSIAALDPSDTQKSGRNTTLRGAGRNVSQAESVKFVGRSFRANILGEVSVGVDSHQKSMNNTGCVFAAATYKDSFSMRCSNGVKFIWHRERGVLHYFDLNVDPNEKHEKIKELTPKDFDKLIAPFLRYLRLGRTTYATNNFRSAISRD